MIEFKNQIGFGFKSENFLVFFGNTNGDLSSIKKEYPNLKILELWQTHSDLVVEATTEEANAWPLFW